MHFPTTTTALISLLITTTLASPLTTITTRDQDQDDDSNNSINIFPRNFNDAYNEFSICRNKVTKHQFPHLAAPSDDGGCVRYYPGIDMTGVVTEVNLFHKDGINSACDCISACLSRPTSCTNWVFKHTFAGANVDGNLRSCTLYSSPNLPGNVTLKYDLAGSTGFDLLMPGNNPQAGGDAPLAFLDQANTKQDKYGVSGFVTRDTNGNQFC